MKHNITGIILAGGLSSRMGQDKGLLHRNGKAMVEQVLKTVSQVCREVMIIANHNGYEQFGVPVFPDIYKEIGPIGGIHSGLLHTSSQYNMVIGCDMPLISSELIEYLISYINNDHDITIPTHQNQPQPLCAVYAKSCLKPLETIIRQGELKMRNIIRQLNTKYVEIDDTLDFYAPELFTNVNWPEDLHIFEKPENLMKFNVLLWGMLGEKAGISSMEVEGIHDLDGLMVKMKLSHPFLNEMNYLIAVNHEVIRDNMALNIDDEIALIPPYAGG